MKSRPGWAIVIQRRSEQVSISLSLLTEVNVGLPDLRVESKHHLHQRIGACSAEVSIRPPLLNSTKGQIHKTQEESNRIASQHTRGLRTASVRLRVRINDDSLLADLDRTSGIFRRWAITAAYQRLPGICRTRGERYFQADSFGD